jgi:uncharacterized protein (UPF0248 family)
MDLTRYFTIPPHATCASTMQSAAAVNRVNPVNVYFYRRTRTPPIPLHRIVEIHYGEGLST